MSKQTMIYGTGLSGEELLFQQQGYLSVKRIEELLYRAEFGGYKDPRCVIESGGEYIGDEFSKIATVICSQ